MASIINTMGRFAHEIALPANKEQKPEQVSIEERVLLENYLMWLHGEALKVRAVVKHNQRRPTDSIGLMMNWGYFRGQEASAASELCGRARVTLLSHPGGEA